MLIKTEEYNSHIIELHTDDYSSSPREDENICIFHIAHRNYSFGDEHYDSLESVRNAENEAIRNGDIVLPLYLYDHSGITISLAPFSCNWDSGQVGFVQIPRNRMLVEFNKKIFTKQLKQKAMAIAAGEVKTLDQYITGEVYGYVIKDKEGCDIDSCWGFYGDEYCMEEAKISVNC